MGSLLTSPTPLEGFRAALGRGTQDSEVHLRPAHSRGTGEIYPLAAVPVEEPSHSGAPSTLPRGSAASPLLYLLTSEDGWIERTGRSLSYKTRVARNSTAQELVVDHALHYLSGLMERDPAHPHGSLIHVQFSSGEAPEEAIAALESPPDVVTVALVEHILAGPPQALELRVVLEEDED